MCANPAAITKVWFHNVELAAAKVIGRETVQHVSNNYKYYIAYHMIRDTHLQKDEICNLHNLPRNKRRKGQAAGVYF